MRYLTFKGKTRQEAFAQFEQEKQNDPSLKEARLIKHSESKISSFMGLKKEAIYEIVIGIPEHFTYSTDLITTKKKSPFTSIEQNILNKKKSINRVEETLFAVNSISRVAQQISQLEKGNKKPQNTSSSRKTQEIETLKNELNSMRDEFKSFQEQLMTSLQNNQNNLLQNTIIDHIEESRSLPNDIEIYKQHIRWIERYLNEREFSRYFIDSIITYLEQNPNLLKDKKDILNSVKKVLLEHIPHIKVNLENYSNGNTVIFIGPTGVGKTSSLVKLAAHLALMRKKQFQFISIDRYKVGGETQLEKLASYMKAPFSTINKQEDFFNLLNNNNYSFTFIDTAGKSPKETIAIQELSQWIQMINSKVDIHLVISATTKSTDLEYICEAYSHINYNHILVTKLDETCNYGSILSIAYLHKKPLTFSTDGQEIPQDFLITDIEQLINNSLL